LQLLIYSRNRCSFACRSLAEKKGFDFHIPRNFLPNQLLELNCDLGKGKLIYNQIFEEIPITYYPEFHNVQDNTLLKGFYQCEKYFESHKKQVKKWFKLPSDTKSDYLYQDNICFIHFRGTDYLDSQWRLPKDYYLRAMNIIRKQEPQIKFIFLTDDPINCKNIFPGENIQMNSVLTDFKLLTMAKYLIVVNSSFSWWVTYLNENAKLIIGPEDWLNYNHYYDKQITGFVPENCKQNKITYIR